MSCEFEHSDGAYVLGALSATGRLAFERHLDDCTGCTARVRHLAGLPGLLGRVSPEVLEETVPAQEPPTLLPTLVARVRREQRRRTRVIATLAAAGALLVVGLGAVAVDAATDGPPTPVASPSVPPSIPAGTEMEAVGSDVPVTASLTLEDVTWGTRIDLTCTYDPTSVEYDLPPEVTYLLVVRTRSGAVEQVGTWRSVGGRTMRFQAGTATVQDDIASVEVRTTDGRVVLTSA